MRAQRPPLSCLPPPRLPSWKAQAGHAVSLQSFTSAASPSGEDRTRASRRASTIPKANLWNAAAFSLFKLGFSSSQNPFYKPSLYQYSDFFLFLEIKPQILNLKVHRAHLVKRTVCSVGGKFKNRPFPTQLWFSPTDQRAQGLWPCVRAFTTAECEINWKTKIYSASMGLTNLLLSKTEKKKKNLSFEAQRCEVEFLQT